ncbi:hypothetical protein P154DRAFT_527400 [Amniculicola lignicola CBS 123094]|uniref:Uncharacterized protein n=1 Tax=Amniculicola lignicola CBS 123094 TaxID=1392246 RepID=A0A6A5W1F3_9PLEO|nr:hypothetical protein P154DRAFT_527400 [Amniculicola lignicola CBS 123094]
MQNHIAQDASSSNLFQSPTSSATAEDTGWKYNPTYCRFYRQTWTGDEWSTTWKELPHDFRQRDASFYCFGRMFAMVSPERQDDLLVDVYIAIEHQNRTRQFYAIEWEKNGISCLLSGTDYKHLPLRIEDSPHVLRRHGADYDPHDTTNTTLKKFPVPEFHEDFPWMSFVKDLGMLREEDIEWLH